MQCLDLRSQAELEVLNCADNYVVGPDCGEYYVDLLYSPFHKNVSIKDIEKYMQSHKIAADYQRVVQSSFTRYLSFPDPEIEYKDF